MEEQTWGEGRVTVGKETRKETVAKTQPGEAGGWRLDRRVNGGGRGGLMLGV